jgi:hypothetical protein
MQVRPNVGAALAACGADKPRLNIGQPQVVRPLVRSMIRTAMISQAHQRPSSAGVIVAALLSARR